MFAGQLSVSIVDVRILKQPDRVRDPKDFGQTYSRDWKDLWQKQNDEQKHDIQRRQKAEKRTEPSQVPRGRFESIPSNCVACDNRDQIREVGGNSGPKCSR